LVDLLEDQLNSEEYEYWYETYEPFQELNLDVSTEELLSAEKAFTYADLYATLGNEDTVAWLTPHASVSRVDGGARTAWQQLDESCHFCFSADDTYILAFARSSEHLLEICDVVLRLLAVSVVRSVTIDEWSCPDGALISAPAFADFIEQCQSLRLLSFKELDVSLEMDEDQCRALGVSSRPDLEIELKHSTITSAGARALTEVLGRNQGPTKLDCCFIDNSVLADGLRGNSRLRSLNLCLSENPEVGHRERLAIAGALRENKGLVDLDLSCFDFRVTDETWGAVCDSLHAHPTLEVLDLRTHGTSGMVPLVPAVIKSQIQALLDMMKTNTSIRTIHLNSDYSQHEIFRKSVIPYLETNRFRPRLLAIQKTRPIPYRAKVLGRALLAARTDANSFWMILSGNAEVAFPSITTTTAAAANLPTPAAAATTTTVPGSLPATATNATSSVILSTASTSNAFAPTVAANLATPSAGQKRKVRR
jgi:hypothetical protein